MSLVRKGYALSTRREFLGALFSALLALDLFDPGVAPAQEGKQIKLTEKHIQNFMGAYNDMVKVYESADPDKPDPKVEAQAEAVAKKNGFASLPNLMTCRSVYQWSCPASTELSPNLGDGRDQAAAI